MRDCALCMCKIYADFFFRPEYNSTLRMKLEAERLKESEVDIQTALQRKLRISESVKTDINEKVRCKWQCIYKDI